MDVQKHLDTIIHHPSCKCCKCKPEDYTYDDIEDLKIKIAETMFVSERMRNYLSPVFEYFAVVEEGHIELIKGQLPLAIKMIKEIKDVMPNM